MRILATVAFSFAAAVFAAVLLPLDSWWQVAAPLLGALGVVAVVLRGRLPGQWGVRLGLMGLSAAVALLYVTGYQALFVAPLQDNLGKELPFTATVCDGAQPTDYGAKVTVSLGAGQKAVYYGDASLLTLRPGQTLSGNAYWQNAAVIREDEITTFTSRGVYVLLYARGDAQVGEGNSASLRYLPQRVAGAVAEKVGEIWQDDTVAAFVTAMLIGERSGLTVEDQTAMSEAGLSHLFAVSGLHCTFLVTLLGLLIPTRRRRTFAVVAIGVLCFYMFMAGLSPSIVRSCIMLCFVLTAPIFRRDSDSLTALSAALLVILLFNPYAAASISLQLSFAATAGILLVGGRVHGWLMKLPVKGRILAALWRFLAASASASLGALVFTVPLTAFYFNIFTLLSPLSNLLVVPVAGWAFMVAFVSVLVGFVYLPAAQLLGLATAVLVRYALWVAYAVMALPGHALYFTNRYLKYWLLYAYGTLVPALLTRRKRTCFLAASLAALTLALTVVLGSAEFRRGQALGVLALDVGQGASTVLFSGDEAAVVDCGSANSYIDAGGVAADQLHTMGIHRLRAVVVTHYHADHTDGLYELLSRVPVETLYLPRVEDEYGVGERLLALAEEWGIEAVYVDEITLCPLGEATVSVYPPIGEGDMNEQGLTVLCSAGEYDALITGDMAASTERELLERYSLPDIELLLVGHHGSRYGTSRELLKELQPETAIISVGDNSYGHPSEEALLRLMAAGCTIYRTDVQGSVLATYGGEANGQ